MTPFFNNHSQDSVLNITCEITPFFNNRSQDLVLNITCEITPFFKNHSQDPVLNITCEITPFFNNHSHYLFTFNQQLQPQFELRHVPITFNWEVNPRTASTFSSIDMGNVSDFASKQEYLAKTHCYGV
ncbi:hypothetical protein scyTo_0011525 [Scyliorhinus torazame]|uniref:Uncharacterized protein n=1 Tax=Scyliorhinus torazame TaxID=75743 RepID=A0A401NPI0_SCYTO|nr:hypothetical protein [Scyliorhinus torazame]